MEIHSVVIVEGFCEDTCSTASESCSEHGEEGCQLLRQPLLVLVYLLIVTSCVVTGHCLKDLISAGRFSSSLCKRVPIQNHHIYITHPA